MPVRTAMAFLRFSKGGRVQRLLHALKYGNRPEVGEVLGSLCGVRVYGTDLAASADLIIPVPLHISRQRKRGYNQSARFAEGLSKTLKIPYSDTFLERTVKTETQTRKSRIARWENVQHAFRVKVPREIAGKNIVLVDDVVTTGATLQACIHVLMAAGCAEVRVICIAEA
jgi:ComF family protein